MIEYKQDPRYDIEYRITIQYCPNYRKHIGSYSDYDTAKKHYDDLYEMFSSKVPIWIEKCEWKKI